MDVGNSGQTCYSSQDKRPRHGCGEQWTNLLFFPRQEAQAWMWGTVDKPAILPKTRGPGMDVGNSGQTCYSSQDKRPRHGCGEQWTNLLFFPRQEAQAWMWGTVDKPAILPKTRGPGMDVGNSGQTCYSSQDKRPRHGCGEQWTNLLFFPRQEAQAWMWGTVDKPAILPKTSGPGMDVGNSGQTCYSSQDKRPRHGCGEQWTNLLFFPRQEAQAWMWGTVDKPAILPKTRGSGNMVCDFIEVQSGYFCFLLEELEREERIQPTFHRKLGSYSNMEQLGTVTGLVRYSWTTEKTLQCTQLSGYLVRVAATELFHLML